MGNVGKEKQNDHKKAYDKVDQLRSQEETDISDIIKPKILK